MGKEFIIADAPYYQQLRLARKWLLTEHAGWIAGNPDVELNSHYSSRLILSGRPAWTASLISSDLYASNRVRWFERVLF